MKKRRVRDKFIDELRSTPIVQVACDKLGISRQTFYRWKQEDSLFSARVDLALNQGESFVNDIAESNVLRGIKNQDKDYTKYWLSHRHTKFKKQYEQRSNSRTVVHDVEASRAFFRRWSTPTANQNRPQIPVSENPVSSVGNPEKPLQAE